jgi:hypothetical protein
VPHAPEFPVGLVGTEKHYAVLLNETARANAGWGYVQEIRVSHSFFARCGIHGSIPLALFPYHCSGTRPAYPTSREKRARYGAPIGPWSGQSLSPEVRTNWAQRSGLSFGAAVRRGCHRKRNGRSFWAARFILNFYCSRNVLPIRVGNHDFEVEGGGDRFVANRAWREAVLADSGEDA